MAQTLTFYICQPCKDSWQTNSMLLIIYRLKTVDIRSTDSLEVEEFKFSLKSWVQDEEDIMFSL